MLFTNEHVIGLGKDQLESHIITYPNRGYVGRTNLSSAHHGEATMETTHPEAKRRDHRFLADWAIIKVQSATKGPIELVTSNDGKCAHVKALSISRQEEPQN